MILKGFIRDSRVWAFPSYGQELSVECNQKWVVFHYRYRAWVSAKFASNRQTTIISEWLLPTSYSTRDYVGDRHTSQLSAMFNRKMQKAIHCVPDISTSLFSYLLTKDTHSSSTRRAWPKFYFRRRCGAVYNNLLHYTAIYRVCSIEYFIHSIRHVAMDIHSELYIFDMTRYKISLGSDNQHAAGGNRVNTKNVYRWFSARLQ